MRTTDAVITTSDPVTGQLVLADARDMASDAEQARVRDMLYGALDTSLSSNPYVDRRTEGWAQQDSSGLKPWLVTFKDGSTYRVSRMLDQLVDSPGSKFVLDGNGGVTFVPKGYTEPAPIAGPGPNVFGNMDPESLEDWQKALFAQLDRIEAAL